MVATCQAGVFQYRGLPSRFLQEPKEETEFGLCLGEETCAVVRTRAMQREEKEALRKNKARITYYKWEN